MARSRSRKSIQGAFLHVYKCLIGYSVILSVMPDGRQDVVQVDDLGSSRRVLRLAPALHELCALHDAVYVMSRPLVIVVPADILAKLHRRTFASIAPLLAPQALCAPEVFTARTESWLTRIGADLDVFTALAPTATMATPELVSTSQMMANPAS